ncbi:phosphotransferase [Amycolatopsis thermoflava]|uniref:phosphotransferase n=1 Tax=Amycolatopsis thermoflava TaxID=84480 RepID=UPI0003F73F5A|nr:phosphotransferase [Amycolatopsis thermoflava]
MPRSTWDELPATVRAAIERKAGLVARAEIPSAGRNSDFSATLHLRSGGVVFCKGIADAEAKRGAMHRHEADINPWLPSAIAPRLRWRIEADGWLLLGFDRVMGAHADLAPGSPDLPVVAAAVAALGRDLADCPAAAPRLADQWARLAPWRRLAKNPPPGLSVPEQLITWEARAVEAADGHDLVHTDLHSLNILVSGRRAMIIDWAWSRTGSAAVDVAFLIARLITAGHTPSAAEEWAEALPVWQRTPSAVRTALAVEIWGIWQYQAAQQRRDLWRTLVPAARAWAAHRLNRSTVLEHQFDDVLASWHERGGSER